MCASNVRVLVYVRLFGERTDSDHRISYLSADTEDKQPARRSRLQAYGLQSQQSGYTSDGRLAAVGEVASTAAQSMHSFTLTGFWQKLLGLSGSQL